MGACWPWVPLAWLCESRGLQDNRLGYLRAHFYKPHTQSVGILPVIKQKSRFGVRRSSSETVQPFWACNLWLAGLRETSDKQNVTAHSGLPRSGWEKPSFEEDFPSSPEESPAAELSLLPWPRVWDLLFSRP